MARERNPPKVGQFIDATKVFPKPPLSGGGVRPLIGNGPIGARDPRFPLFEPSFPLRTDREIASTGVTGTLAYTNANDTLAATGTPTLTGSLSKTNNNDTLAGTGTTVIVGTLATTNNNDTLAASGTTTITGTLATTNANDTLVASGSVGATVTGTLAYTNNNDTLAASGTTVIVGTLAKTNNNDTLSSSGTTTVTGTVSYTNNNDTLAASGQAGAVTGTVNYTNNDDTLVASGTAGTIVTIVYDPGDKPWTPSPHKGWNKTQWRKLRAKDDELQSSLTEMWNVLMGVETPVEILAEVVQALKPEKIKNESMPVWSDLKLETINNVIALYNEEISRRELFLRQEEEEFLLL